MLGHSVSKNSLVLGIFAAVTAATIALTFQGTKTLIAKEERKAALAALVDMIPNSRHNNDLLRDTVVLSKADSQALGFNQLVELNIAKMDNKPIALVIPAIAHDGYSGDIKMIIAVNLDSTLAGVRILAHKETPGLGDKIDLRKSQWIHSFDGVSLINPARQFWKVKKDGGEFDQFTGATVTPRAVVKRVKETLEFFEQRKTEWLSSITNKTIDLSSTEPRYE
jgi:electron transport complex protein RnfG